MSGPRVVILVPRRAGCPVRDRTWTWIRAWWEKHFPEWSIVEGHQGEGLFNRSAAINRAAREAGAWDAAIILDADVLVDPGRMREAVTRACQSGRFTMPFTLRKDLNRNGSEKIMAGYEGSWESFVYRRYADMCSMIVVVTRELWEKTGGFDEKFRGWGFEDNAFSIACETLSGQRIERLEGEAWHFWHPTAPEGKRGSPSLEANRARKRLYDQAWGDPAKLARLTNGRAQASPSSPPQAQPAEGIPRKLHRIVPAVTTDEVETWWDGFAALHPTWELLTHRDPQDPADWPETSPFWERCSSGAQLAGLLRLECLWRHGGIYVDSDFIPYQPFDALLGLSCFAGWEDARCVPDALIGAVPGHPAIRACLDLALSKLPAGAWETGPGVTTAILPGRKDVLLFPPGTFYPVHYREKAKAPDPRAAQPWAMARHMWAHSWAGK